MEKMNGKLVTFTGIIVLVLLVAIFGFLFWEPKPEYIQGEAEATEVRISGKVPGRIEIFRFNEGEQVSRGDTVAILDSPEVLAKYSQAEAAEAAAQALNEKAERGTRSEQIVMTYQTWQKAKAAAEVAKKTYDRILKLYESEVVPAQKKDEAEANYKAMMATEQAAKAQYEMARNGAQREDKQAAEAQLNRAKGAVAEVEAYVKETYLISPIDGEISERYPKVGELVGTGAPVMDILDLSDISGGPRAPARNRRSATKAFVPALDNREVELKVTYLKDMGSYAAWRATKTTGQYDVKTFRVKAKPVDKVDGLRPGMSVLKKL